MKELNRRRTRFFFFNIFLCSALGTVNVVKGFKYGCQVQADFKPQLWSQWVVFKIRRKTSISDEPI